MPHPKFGKIGFVLCGGGCAEGLPQAAQLRVFYEKGIIPDYIIAVSVGAYNAIAYNDALPIWQKYIRSPDAIYKINGELRKIFEEKMKIIPHSPFHHHETWKELVSDFFNQGKHLTQFAKQIWAFGSRIINSLVYLQTNNGSNPNNLTPVVKEIFSHIQESGLDKIPGVLDIEPLITLLKQKLDLKRVLSEDLKLQILARSLEHGEEHIFTPRTEAELFIAAQASSALRPFFPPVQIDGKYYCDGGHMNPLPIKYAFDFECDTIFVFAKNYYEYRPTFNLFESLFEELNISQRVLFSKLLDEAKKTAVKENWRLHVVFPQPLHPDLQLLWISPEALEHTIKIERETTEKFLQTIL